MLRLRLAFTCWALSVCLQSSVFAQESQNWPRLLNSTFDGVATTPADSIDWKAKPSFAWSLDVGEGYGLGSVDSGKYYHYDAVDFKERVRCVDLITGKVIWSETDGFAYRDMLGYEDGPRTTPTIAGDAVILFGVAGRLSSRNKTTGKLNWAVDTNDEYGVVQNFFGVGSSPLIIDDMVIAMVGGSPAEDSRIAPGRLNRVSPNGSAIVAFDLKTGKERWKSGDDLASYSSPRTMKIDGRTIILAFARDNLLAIDSETGKLLWKYYHRAEILESVNAIVPVVDEQHIFISECYEVGSALLKASLTKPEVVWKDPPQNRRLQAMRIHWSTPALIDGFLYGCSGRNAPDSGFRCIEFMTGKVQWADERRTRSSVTRVGNRLVLLEERGLLQILNPDPAKMIIDGEWNLSEPDDARPAISYPCWAAPVVVGRTVLVRGDKKVLCLKLHGK